MAGPPGPAPKDVGARLCAGAVGRPGSRARRWPPRRQDEGRRGLRGYPNAGPDKARLRTTGPKVILTTAPEELRAYMDDARRDGKQVGLHLTMGALHAGHRANIRRAAAECDAVAVTIFVNPLQFGPNEDFGAYPRDLGTDIAHAEDAGADIVLAPGTEAMYPEEPLVTVHVKRLGEILEGRHRPGHFDGVATVVAKFLALSGPCRAYFGEKDYQQLVVVRRLVTDLSLPVDVVPCPTVREPDGLAMSSRNAYLGPRNAWRHGRFIGPCWPGSGRWKSRA